MPECPNYDLECPYCQWDGTCLLESPETDCDDYMYWMNEDEEEEEN